MLPLTPAQVDLLRQREGGGALPNLGGFSRDGEPLAVTQPVSRARTRAQAILLERPAVGN